MRITWNNPKEIKDFILHVDLSYFVKNEETDWGTAGLIICAPSTSRLNSEEKDNHGDSFTLSDHGDRLICTPHVRELVWLMQQFMHYMEEQLNVSTAFDCVWAASTAFFLQHKGNYDAKELLMYIIDFLDSVLISHREQECTD